MNKKLLTGIIIAIIIVAIGIGVYFIFFSSKKQETKELNLSEISNNITEASFSEMAMSDLDKETLQTYMQVKTENVEEVYGKIPLMNVQASMYVLIKAVDGKAEAVKADIEAFGVSYDEQWGRYLPDQYELVQNRKIGTIGNYVYMIIAENVEELEKLVK